MNGISIGGLIYLVIGLFVASSHGYFATIGTIADSVSDYRRAVVATRVFGCKPAFGAVSGYCKKSNNIV